MKLAETLAAAAVAAMLLWGLLAMADRLAAWSAAATLRAQAGANAGRLIERLASEAVSAESIAAPNATEIAFTSQDGAHRTYAWSYTFDAAAKTVTRSTGEVYTGIDALTAASAVPNADPLFAGASVANVSATQMVDVQIEASGVSRDVLLASGDAPTSFTVVAQYTPSPTPVVTPTPVPLVLY
jgi:hypothetical protein